MPDLTPEQEQERNDQEFAKYRAKVDAYKRLFSTEDGKVVLADLKQTYHMNGTTLTPGDSYGTHYHEGQRTVVLGIQNKIDMEFRQPDNLTQKA
jgi:hypothetical protein